jgi:hypothetical protein
MLCFNPLSISNRKTVFELAGVPVSNTCVGRLEWQKGFDAILIDDFLYDHHPEIRPLWNNMFECKSKVVEKSHTLARLIDERLRTLCTYRYLDEPGNLDYNEFDL